MTKYLLLVIILFFFATRIFKITEIPGSVYWDEASIGYNAYSITQDLRDEWGEFLPLHFRAFGEFKLPVYIYSVVPFIEIFGLGELAVRLPAVFYSIGSVIIFYLFVSKMTKENWVGLLAAFILSVSPWLFIFSRTGYEVTAGLFFFLLFIYFLLLYKERNLYILPGIIAGILSIYSYNAFRILVPIFMIVWAITQRHKNVRPEVLGLLIFLLSLVPIARLYQLDQGAIRFGTVGIKSTTEFVSSYVFHFDFKFLFLEGDVNNRSQVPGWGELYLVDLPLLLLGFWFIIKGKNRLLWLFPVFVLTGPIPASLTKESPHALRSILSVLGFVGMSSLGLFYLSEKFKKYQKFIIAVAVGVYLLFFESYYSDFIKNYNRKTSSDWQYEYKEIFKKTRSGVITDRYAQPYIFALYYLKYPAEEFRKTVKYNPPDKWGFSTVYSFDDLVFKKQ